MTNDQVPVDESEEGKRKPQRNEAGNEDPTATPIEETKKKNTMKKEMVELQTR
ncbi:MAG: hypothetical protein ACJ702_04415 [Nitrososphaeraceae archaeon]